jgi:phosphatidylglycerophosphate synthase
LAIAAGVQLVVLAALSVAGELGPVGWLAAVGFAVGLGGLLAGAARRAGIDRLGPADLVTLGRSVLVGGVTGLVADGLVTGSTPVAVVASLAAVALLLDAVDGRVARRTGTAKPMGARFDMEVDSFLVLVLSVYVATELGPWVLVIGTMRYGFVAAGWALPWLRAPLSVRHSAKFVAAAQGIVLVVAAAGVLPSPVAVGVVATALALLVWSFGYDARRLWRAAEDRAAHPVAARAASALAVLLVVVALVAPNQMGLFTPGAFARIPAEALVGVAVLLALTARPRRVVAVAAGAVLGLLTIVKVFDLGFSAVLGRPFDLVGDWPLIGSGLDFVAGSWGYLGAVAAVVAAAGAGSAVLVVLTRSVLRLSRVADRNRRAATSTVAVLGAAWVTCALLGAQLVPGLPIAAGDAAATVRERVAQVGAGLADRKAFAAAVATDGLGGVPDAELLTALRGKDVVIVFVESYGRDAIEDPALAAQVAPVLDDGTAGLGTAGFTARSGFLTSPVAGGGSWLAHATFFSGLWVDNQQRHDTLVASDRLTLPSAFGRAGWRTVAVMPGSSGDWSEAAFYGHQQVYDYGRLGYRGPDLGWASMPDQYTLSAFERLERSAPDRGPLLAEIALVSSHAPWRFVPPLVDWADIGDGTVFGPLAAGTAPREAAWTAGAAAARAEYARAIAYSLRSIVSYVETYGDDDLVLLVLGDHQPAPLVTGEGAGRDVPISVVTRDREVLDRIAPWGWQDGLRPGPQAPVWPMDAFRDRFLATFGPDGVAPDADDALPVAAGSGLPG